MLINADRHWCVARKSFAQASLALAGALLLSGCSDALEQAASALNTGQSELRALLQRRAELEAAIAAGAPTTPECPVGPAVNAPSGTGLAAALERATALVLVRGQQGLGMGTGFFIHDDLLVTNRHVIEATSTTDVVVVSRALGQPRIAKVVKVSRSSDFGEPDLAVLRLRDGTAPGKLALGPPAAKLVEVIAAGYPGLVTNNDPTFQRLMEGDLQSAPDLNLTKGSVQSLQTSDSGVPLVLHTAAISGGNSGGPLVDACGRVVGVNTFINVDSGQAARVSYAIGTDVLKVFLRSAGIDLPADNRACAVAN